MQMIRYITKKQGTKTCFYDIVDMSGGLISEVKLISLP